MNPKFVGSTVILKNYRYEPEFNRFCFERYRQTNQRPRADSTTTATLNPSPKICSHTDCAPMMPKAIAPPIASKKIQNIVSLPYNLEHIEASG